MTGNDRFQAAVSEVRREEEFDPRELLRVVMKRWKMMAAIMILVMGLAISYVVLAKPIWQATVTVKLPADNASDPLKELVALSSASSQADPIVTYMQIAESFNVAIRAAHAVNLMSYQEFSQANNLTEVAEGLIKSKIVEISNVKDSDILEFDAKVQDPSLAVKLADAWAQAFIDANLDFERAGASSQHQFIASQLSELKIGLTNDEQALERLSQSQEMLHPEGTASGEGGAGGSAMLNPILSLQTRVQDLLIEKSELAIRYRPDYPGVKEVDAQYKAARAQLSQVLRKLPVDDMNYARLDREVKADEFIYELLLQKDQEARIEENVNNSGIVVVDSALPPTRPIAPKKAVILALALVGALMIGFGAAVGLERWLDEVNSEGEIVRLSGLPVLAVISDWGSESAGSNKEIRRSLKAGKRILGPMALINHPQMKHTYYSEAFRALRTNLAFSGVDRQLKSMAVVSANSMEGKTLTNANLALALAAAGKKVLLVDADLRKPSVHKLFGLQVRSTQGLPLLLSGQSAELNDHLFRGPEDNLWILPCGVIAPNPSELLGSEAVKKWLGVFEHSFDQVIFDVAPILPVTDAVALAMHLDGVAILAKFDQTRRVELARALELLRSVKTPLLGVILNGVDMRKYSYAYGYGNSYYSYYGKSETPEKDV